MNSSPEEALFALALAKPAGVLNILPGFGETAGEAIAAHPDVAKLAFTGSTEVAKLIVQAASGNLKKVSLEFGGKSPNVTLDDADVGAPTQGAAAGVFFNSGQVCTAGSRLGMGFGIPVIREGLPQAFSLIVVPPDFVADGAAITGSVDRGEVGLVFHRLGEPVRFWVGDDGFHVTVREQDFAVRSVSKMTPAVMQSSCRGVLLT